MSMASVSYGLLQEVECQHLLVAAKTPQWSELYYGQLPYLVTFVAAKTDLQFYIIERGDVAHQRLLGQRLCWIQFEGASHCC